MSTYQIEVRSEDRRYNLRMSSQKDILGILREILEFNCDRDITDIDMDRTLTHTTPYENRAQLAIDDVLIQVWDITDATTHRYTVDD